KSVAAMTHAPAAFSLKRGAGEGAVERANLSVESKAHPFAGDGFGLMGPVWRVGFFLLATVAATASAAPVFLGVSAGNDEHRPELVLAGRTTELTLTLSASEPLTPVLGLDLFVAGGALAAPLARDLHPELQRQGPAAAGVQKFNF